MSAQPGRPPAQPPPQAGPQPPQAPEMQQLLEQLLGGELPGQGYLYADDPAKRQQQLVRTTPDFVRANLLRAIEVMTFDLQLPFSEDKKADVGHALLAAAQAYLLLDPSVDQEGVSIEGRANAEAQAQARFPPRVPPNAAEGKIKTKNESKSKALRGTRPQQPRPSPRIGS